MAFHDFLLYNVLHRHPEGKGENMIYSKNIEPSCGICARASEITDSDCLLCTKNGVVMHYYHCRKFQYDPLKRDPKRAPSLPQYDAGDFSLE